MNRSLARLLKIVLLIGALGLMLPASGALGAKPVQTAKQPTATGTGGAVATVDLDASRVGMQVLRGGGNAVDAAVAAAAALGVTEPYSCGIGGGGFMVIYDADNGSVSTIDSRETAPAAFKPDSFIEDPSTGQPIPFEERVTSGLGVGVPGTIRGWEQALGEFGSRPLSELLQPSIRLAARGFEVDQTYRQQTLDNLARFRDFTSTRETFLRNGQAPAVGSTFRNPNLAATYSRIADGVGNAFYSGQTARAIVNTVQDPPLVDGSARNVRPGLMTTTDVKITPANGATGVLITTRATATFSEAMDPGTLTGKTVTLLKTGTTTPIAAKVSYDVVSKTLTLVPSVILAKRTKYTVRIEGGGDTDGLAVKDVAGNGLAADKVWSFTTGLK